MHHEHSHPGHANGSVAWFQVVAHISPLQNYDIKDVTKRQASLFFKVLVDLKIVRSNIDKPELVLYCSNARHGGIVALSYCTQNSVERSHCCTSHMLGHGMSYSTVGLCSL